MQASFDIGREQRTLIISASGSWERSELRGAAVSAAPLMEAAFSALDDAELQTVIFLAPDLESWDSLLLAAMNSVAREAVKRGLSVNIDALPEGIGPMLDMALAVAPSDQECPPLHEGFLESLGGKVLAIPAICRDVLEFLGEVSQSLFRFLRGKASFSHRDLWDVFRECGVDALPIVSLTSLLLGLILAFVSSMQLKLFGAEIYVASLVGVSMVRVMGPVLTGIVIAGRTGASFAAVIGSMQVNEEVDALTGFGISPMDFLVLPRLLGLAIMTPLLTLYANIAGIVGGFLVGVLMLGITPAAYMANTLSLMKMSYVWVGLLHAFVFGILIALCGCYQGIRSGRNASAVGRATTSAVVNSIVGIIVATSIITIIFTVVDI